MFDRMHIVANPIGHQPGYNYHAVGMVPTEIANVRQWETAEALAGAAREAGAMLCDDNECACVKG